jgi:hypothetical protein
LLNVSNYSLNSAASCLTMLDTFRNVSMKIKHLSIVVTWSLLGVALALILGDMTFACTQVDIVSPSSSPGLIAAGSSPSLLQEVVTESWSAERTKARAALEPQCPLSPIDSRLDCHR